MSPFHRGRCPVRFVNTGAHVLNLNKYMWRGQAVLKRQYEGARFGLPLGQVGAGAEVARLAFGCCPWGC